MKNIVHATMLVVVLFGLGGCFKVENEGDGKIIDALEEQNEILQEQVDQSAAQKTSVTLTGLIYNLSTDAVATSGTITITIGSSVSQTTTLNNGVFEFKNLPADSDFVLVVHSGNGGFMDRTIFDSTKETTSPGPVLQDIGQINVAQGVERQFSVIETNTNQPVPSLTFYSSSNQGSGSTEKNYWHKAVYNADLKTYTITLPEKMDLGVHASLDVNSDGVPEYFSQGSPVLSMGAFSLMTTAAFFVTDNPWAEIFNESIEVRIAVINNAALFIPDLTLFVQDALNGVVSSSFDATTNQYVIKSKINESLTIRLPEFKIGSTYYSSSTVNISRNSDGRYCVSTSGFFCSDYPFSFAEDEAPVFNVTLKPSEYIPSSSINVVAKTEMIDLVNPQYNVFYSGAIELLPSSVILNRKNVLQVVRGNDSDSDLILPGSTAVSLLNESVPVSSQLSLGDTALTAAPQTALAPGSYEYLVGVVIDKKLGIFSDIWNDGAEFNARSTSAFDINALVLDNNNYYNSGNVIRAANTAGASSTPWYHASSVYMYFPDSVSNLKTLTLSVQSVTENNVAALGGNTFTVVSNGVSNLSTAYVVSGAENENFIGSVWPQEGTTLADGKYSYMSISEHMEDNTGANVNSVTFLYAYETLDGVTSTGTITLPVR